MVMILQKLFSHFIIVENLNLNLNELKEFAYSTQRNSEGRVLSNSGGWQSNHFFSNQKNALSPLFHEIEKTMFEVKNEFSMKNTFYVDNLWININRKTNFNKPHYHPQSFYSGTFYIKTPKNCGKLCLLSPAMGYETYVSNLKFENHNEYNISNWNIEPRENLLVLFPSWIQHYVEPNLSQEDRISISFNINTNKV